MDPAEEEGAELSELESARTSVEDSTSDRVTSRFSLAGAIAGAKHKVKGATGFTDQSKIKSQMGKDDAGVDLKYLSDAIDGCVLHPTSIPRASNVHTP